MNSDVVYGVIREPLSAPYLIVVRLGQNMVKFDLYLCKTLTPTPYLASTRSPLLRMNNTNIRITPCPDRTRQVWWGVRDLNPRPRRYERPALTTELTPQSGQV